MKEELKSLSEQNKNINRGYRELNVWKEAVELFYFVREKLKTLDNLSFKINAQVEDSIFSVQSNIAEGYCRRSIKENIQYLAISLSSLGENYSQIFTLTNSNDIDIDWFKEYDKKHYSLENKLIKLNQSYISKMKSKEEWKNDYILREIIENYNLK
ncbi:MAG: four helix bundle protein [Ignavibacteriota bacterium]|jgi:four helix bundle protein|nr:four helix bundle protein [Ignavibacteriales bacterium]MBL1121616.1 four helix bundle protein [Ignavibacteriota bacterium]MCC7093805.1 four helix bundle protein [Ignavibacteriaceae bacterium]MCE7856756.1 four helix bundle protein [Ignavibacteria bacterium CHB3]MEB2297078.1 four helix bundle protein [Ignavibacteria bacterium]